MMENNAKSQEALQDAEKPAVPPPAYQERSSTYIETDDFHMIDAQDIMTQEDTNPVAGPSRVSLSYEAPQQTKQVETPKRMSSILKGKGPADPVPAAAPTYAQEQSMPVDEKKGWIAAPPTLPSAEEEKRELQAHYAEPPAGEEKRVPQAHYAEPSVEEEKRAMQVRFAESQEEEPAPELPRRPSGSVDKTSSHESLHSVSSKPLNYIFAWNRPLLDFPTLEITPADDAPIPSSSPMVPPTSHWRLNYDKKYHARLHRYTTTPHDVNRNTAQVGDFPYRQIAEIKFPEFIIPGAGCGAMVKFDTHEEELTRLGSYATARGKKPIPRVQKFMQCEGWLTTSYMMEVPVLDHLQASWKSAPRPKPVNAVPEQGGITKETAIVERKTTDMEREAKKQNVALVTIGDMIETAKRAINNETWTPYAPQQLVVESDGRVAATYQRASPFAKHAGVLTIHQPEVDQVSNLAEFIEGIVIATTAMVGMQDRIGLASGLMEAASTSSKWSHERWMKLQREWKDRRAKRQSTAANPRAIDGGASKEQEARENTKPGSEAFNNQTSNIQAFDNQSLNSQTVDDGLGAALGVQEREAARREQIAWDEHAKARSQDIDDDLAGVISAEEREAARREHLAWEERNRNDGQSTHVFGADPSQQAKIWEEKPKVVYA